MGFAFRDEGATGCAAMKARAMAIRAPNRMLLKLEVGSIGLYAGTTDALAWPLAEDAPGEPMGAVLAWSRAGARDPRCLWWVVERYGVAELVEALDEALVALPGSQVEAAHA